MKNGKWYIENLVKVFYSLDLTCHSSGEHQPNHFVVAHERPDWVLKRRRPVLFNQEVSDPCRSVTRNQTKKK